MPEIYCKTKKDSDFQQIKDIRPGCFIYVKQANMEDLDQIDRLVSYEIGDIHGSIDKYEIPRLEKHKNNLILFTRHPGEQEIGLYTEPLTFIIAKDYFIAISPYSNPLIEHMLLLNPETTKIDKAHQLATADRPRMLLYFLNRVSYQFTMSIKKVRHSILLHEQPSKMIDNQTIIALTKNEEILNQYLTSLVSMRNLLENLISHRYLDLPEKEQEVLQEIGIGIGQSEELCRVNVKSIRSLRDAYQIIFTNDVNKTIKRLTAITILLSIPTMIASIYGMNIALPMHGHPHAFFFIMGFACLSCVCATIIFFKNRWF